MSVTLKMWWASKCIHIKGNWYFVSRCDTPERKGCFIMKCNDGQYSDSYTDVSYVGSQRQMPLQEVERQEAEELERSFTCTD